MRYKPRYKTAKEIILERGYTNANRGYERVLIPEKKPKHVLGIIKKGGSVTVASTRFHALPTLDGGIDLHLDVPSLEDKTKHISKKYCDQVASEIKEIMKLDISNKWYLNLWDTLVNFRV